MANTAKLKETITGFFSSAKDTIGYLEDFKSLSGEEKKGRLNKRIVEYLEKSMDTLGLNIVFRWAIKKLIIDNIPTITQAIFDLVKARVDGVTK